MKNRFSPAFLLRPYSLSPKRPEREAWTEEDSITGQVLPYFLSVSRRVDAKPQLPFMNSPLSFGRFTPARLNTKSQSRHHASSCSGVESRSYSYMEPIRRSP